MVSLSALGMLAAIGTMSLGPLSALFSLDAGSRTVAMALSQARVLAITRGHVVDVTFGSGGLVIRDTQADQQLMGGEIPAPVTMEASGVASFSALGTVAAPLVVTLERAGDIRLVRVALTGEVEIE